MAFNALNTVQNNAIIAAKETNDNAITGKKGSNIIKKDYILNDLEAIKKKMDNEHLSPEIQITSEAAGGSNTVVSMKTSLFEYSKCYLMEALKQDSSNGFEQLAGQGRSFNISASYAF